MSDAGVSIYSRLASALRLNGVGLVGATRDALLIGLIAGGPLALAAAYWLVWHQSALASEPTYLLPAALLASLWLPLGPALTVFTERLLRVTLEVIDCDVLSGWHNVEIRRKILRARRLYWPCVAFAAIVAGVAVSFAASTLVDMFALRSAAAQVLGVLVVASLALAAGSGIWGMFTTLVLLIVATKREIDWHPFTVGQAPGLEALSRYGYFAGLALSLSSLQAPVFYRVASVLPPVPRGALYLAITTILASGLAVFAAASGLISSLTRRQLAAAIDPIADELREAWDALVHERATPVQLARFSALLEARQAIRSERAAPYLTFTLGRAAATVIVPVAVGVLPLLAAA